MCRAGEGGSGGGSWTRVEIAADGTRVTMTCTDSRFTMTGQSGESFVGYVLRGRPCPEERAEAAGTASAGGALRFTLADARSGDCQSLAPGHYSGRVVQDRLTASGSARFRCPDGRETTVEETFYLALSHAPFPGP